jgi:hypothetical protein
MQADEFSDVADLAQPFPIVFRSLHAEDGDYLLRHEIVDWRVGRKTTSRRPHKNAALTGKKMGQETMLQCNSTITRPSTRTVSYDWRVID